MAEEESEPTEINIFYEDDTVCPICLAEFIDVDDLQTHILQVHQTQPVKTPKSPQSEYYKHQCRFCNDYFASALDFALHLRDNHIINMKTCAFCIRAFVTRQNLWEHESKHNLDKSSMFSCSQCPMIFTDLSDLEYHELNSHYEGPGMMLQPYYPELSSVLRSQCDCFMQQIGKKTIFKCVCKYSTDDIDVYVKHLQSEECNCYVCNACNKVFSSKRQILRHMQGIKCERPKNTNIIKCSNCCKVVQKKNVKSHRRQCKAVRCTKCQLNFDTLKELAAHKQEKHSRKSISLKECRYCSKSLVGLEMFKEHVEKQHKINYLNYKYNCVYCERIFDHPQRLFTHFNAMHREIRPFVCNICDQTFLLRSKFTYHIKLDHESKGFVEFTKDLNVHFNAEKSPNVVTLKPPASLFTPAEIEELAKSGIKVELTSTKSNKTNTSNDLKRSRLVEKKSSSSQVDNEKAINLNVDDNSEAIPKEIDKSMDTKEPKQTEVDFESSDEEPIKKKIKRKGSYLKKLICNVCEQKCYTIENYNRHMESHKTNKGLKQCLKCCRKFKNIALLKRHIQKQHTTSLIKTLRTMVEQRKQKCQPRVPIIRKEGFICNIEKVYIEPDYRPAAQVTVQHEGAPIPAKKETNVDKVLLRILSERRAAARTRPQIVMQKCVLDDTVELPKKGIKIQRCINSPVKNYEPARLETWHGSIVKPKFDFSNVINQQEDSYYEDEITYEDDVTTYEDVVTTHENHESENNAIYEVTVTEEPKPAKAKLLIIPAAENNEITDTNALLIPNEQTKKFGKLNVATMYYTATGQPAYKILPFEITKEETDEPSEEAKEEAEGAEETLTLPGAPTLVQSNPLAHLMGSDKLMLAQPKTTGKKYKPRLNNPQLKIAQALMELKMPHTRKKQIRIRPPKGKHVKKAVRPENSDAFKYEILDDDAENWVMANED